MHFLTKNLSVKSLPSLPGIYQFFDGKGKILYVGKASNLKKRIQSYFRRRLDSIKTANMMGKACSLSYTVTHTENEALILESKLIKKYCPPFNVLFRDDKSYPYIFISQHKYPQIKFHRNSRKSKGEYFGPFADSTAVHQTLNLLQSVFKVRQCSDNFFANRSRPCLQYQIKRCSAPCVQNISESEYADDIKKTRAFLRSDDNQLLSQLQQEMKMESSKLNYEAAAKIRDQIRMINHVREKQSVVTHGIKGLVDVIVFQQVLNLKCIQIAYIRNGWQHGSKTIWIKDNWQIKGASHSKAQEQLCESEAFILESFITQYYENHGIPSEIILSHPPSNLLMLKEALSKQVGRQVKFSINVRSKRLEILKITTLQAKEAISHRVDQQSLAQYRVKQLQEVLQLPRLPECIECFDISHMMGESVKASVVVFSQGQPKTQDYRLMTIQGVAAGNDYAAIRQVIDRRYKRLQLEYKKMPDIIIVDGGKGQGKVAKEVLQELKIEHIYLLSIAKGEGRISGKETIFLPFEDNRELNVENHPEAFLLLQYIRDEAHRFALTGHRSHRAKKLVKSELDNISGIGSKTKQKLLLHFGGLSPIHKVSVEDLNKINGISTRMAEKIYDYFHVYK